MDGQEQVTNQTDENGLKQGLWVERSGFFTYKRNYKDGKRHGLYEKVVTETDFCVIRENYENDALHGLSEHYDPLTRHCYSRVNYAHNKPHGISEKFDRQTGNPIFKGNFEDGELDGVIEWFDPKTGHCVMRANYKGGKPHGVSEKFDPLTGRRLSKEMYIDSTLESRMVYDLGTGFCTQRSTFAESGIEEREICNRVSGKTIFTEKYRDGIPMLPKKRVRKPSGPAALKAALK